jgi:hypothetical protein
MTAEGSAVRDIRNEPGVERTERGKLCSFVKAIRCDTTMIALALPSGG